MSIITFSVKNVDSRSDRCTSETRSNSDDRWVAPIGPKRIVTRTVHLREWWRYRRALTVSPANDTCTKGSTRSRVSPVNAFFTFATSVLFIFGKPSALYIRTTYLALCRSTGTPSGSSRFLREHKYDIVIL